MIYSERDITDLRFGAIPRRWTGASWDHHWPWFAAFLARASTILWSLTVAMRLFTPSIAWTLGPTRSA
jgi:hypothetical protein